MLKYEIWNLKYEIWKLESEISNMKSEIWNLESEIWNMASRIQFHTALFSYWFTAHTAHYHTLTPHWQQNLAWVVQSEHVTAPTSSKPRMFPLSVVCGRLNYFWVYYCFHFAAKWASIWVFVKLIFQAEACKFKFVSLQQQGHTCVCSKFYTSAVRPGWIDMQAW